MSEEVTITNPFRAEEFAAPVLAEVAAMDTQSVGKELMRLSGHGWWPVQVYQDAFERMTPERALGLYVLAQTLNDIEPLDSEPDPRWSAEQARKHQLHEMKKRRERVQHHQAIEQALRLEGLQIIAEYRQQRRKKPSLRGSGSQHISNKELRGLYKRKLARFKKRREDLDLTNTALEYVLNDREDVRLWCDVADVNVERFYRAVERRLLLKGRCSIELRRLLESFRPRPTGRAEAIDLLAKYEGRAFVVSRN